MPTKEERQQTPIISEEEMRAEQGKSGAVVETKATSAPTAQVDYGTIDEDDIYNDETNIPPKVDANPTPGQTPGRVYVAPPAPKAPNREGIAKEYDDKAEEERKADAKRQKRRALFSAIGDGVSSLANIYYATKGAPDMLKGTTSLSAKNQERWDKYVKGRDARLAEYKKAALDSAEKEYKDEYTRWKDERDYNLKLMQEERLERNAKIKRLKEEAMSLYYNNKATKEEALAMLKAAEAGEFKKFEDLRERREKAETEEAEEKVKTEQTKQTLNKSKAANAGKSGGSSRRGSGGVSKKGNEYIAWDGEGNPRYFSSAKAAEYFAKQEGTWVDATRDTDKSRKNTSSKSSGGFPGRPSKIGGKRAKMPGVK